MIYNRKELLMNPKDRDDDEMLRSLVKDEEEREQKLISSLANEQRPKRNKVINEHEIADLKIMLHTCNNGLELIENIKRM
jgi:hypothetical protein